MAGKTNFTPEEWGRVLASPLVAAMAITAADPSGLWGLLKESLSGGFAILEARQDTNANPLVRDVARDFATPEGRTVSRAALQARFSGLKIDAVKDAALDELKAVSAILDLKAPTDAPAFKAWLKDVASKAAEAGTEGGFLGFGGVAVSEPEKAALADIAGSLGPAGPASS
jgi:hypothetical protein